MRLSARDYANGILTQLEFEINDKSQAMLKSLKDEMEAFLKELESDISLKGNTIRDNINELKEYK
jgi:hypothetical protein